ncbi:MAG: acyl-CoA dehydrogenase family protein [Acidobacteria bacterium]|nr:acyl-CoA dehydrogenase family protein [Acidobacteriota bacterium]
MILELTPDQRAFQEEVRAFARAEVAPRARDIDERNDVPRDLIARSGALGLTGVTIATEWGGAGRDYVSYALAIEAVAEASATVAVILAVNNSLVAEAIAEFGSRTQRDRWLRALASGAMLGSFALSEAQAGTDAANQQTRATPANGGYVLRGRKVWVANAAVADVAIVFAATEPGIGGRGTSAFLVPLDARGVGKIAGPDSLGVRGLGCVDLELDDVRLDPADMLGGPGEGFGIAMWALEGGRIAIAAQALGVGQAALDEALAHAKRRKTFGQPIANYQAVQWMLADMATELDAARMLMLKAAAAKPIQPRVSLEAAMAKLYASEAAHRAADKAMQILASAGYSRGSRVERLFRDVRATEIYQGTSEVQRMIIAARVLQSA